MPVLIVVLRGTCRASPSGTPGRRRRSWHPRGRTRRNRTRTGSRTRTGRRLGPWEHYSGGSLAAAAAAARGLVGQTQTRRGSSVGSSSSRPSRCGWRRWHSWWWARGHGARTGPRARARWWLRSGNVDDSRLSSRKKADSGTFSIGMLSSGDLVKSPNSLLRSRLNSTVGGPRAQRSNCTVAMHPLSVVVGSCKSKQI